MDGAIARGFEANIGEVASSMFNISIGDKLHLIHDGNETLVRVIGVFRSLNLDSMLQVSKDPFHEVSLSP